MKEKALKSLASILLFFVLAAPAYSEITPLQSEIEEAIICLCGCGQTVKNCPHENCGFAVPARNKIISYLAEGKSKSEIMDLFVNKYGEEVLATPSKKGFNLLGYIMPFVALIVSGGLIMIIIKKWTTTGIKDEESTLERTRQDFGSEIDKKIEKELEEMD